MGRKRSRPIPARLRAEVTGELRGRVDWELINADGTVARRGSQHNLILDRGLNQFGLDTSHNAGSHQTYFWAWRAYAAVGTGSTAPAATQTSLVSEAMRTSTDGGFSAEQVATFAIDAAAKTITAAYPLVRVFTFAANFNLTEFGLSENSTGASPVCIRELFRDGSNNPITLSVQSGQQLKLIHTLYISLPWGAAIPASFTITGYGVVQGTATFFSNNAGLYNQMFYDVFNPAGTVNARIMTAANTGDPTSTAVYSTASANDYPSVAASAYSSGTYSRLRQLVITTAGGNFDEYGWAFTKESNQNILNFGWKFCLTNPVKFTKTNAYKLTLDWVVSWARGA